MNMVLVIIGVVLFTVLMRHDLRIDIGDVKTKK